MRGDDVSVIQVSDLENDDMQDIVSDRVECSHHTSLRNRRGTLQY